MSVIHHGTNLMEEKAAHPDTYNHCGMVYMTAFDHQKSVVLTFGATHVANVTELYTYASSWLHNCIHSVTLKLTATEEFTGLKNPPKGGICIY